MANENSTFAFSFTGDKRIFHHIIEVDGLRKGCPHCVTTCNTSAPLAEHWQKDFDVIDEDDKDKISQRMGRLAVIDEGPVTHFITRDDARDIFCSFIYNTRTYEVPALLRFIFPLATRLYIKVHIYTNVADTTFVLFSSNEVELAHHLDIKPTVDVIFQALMTKIDQYMCTNYGRRFVSYKVPRIKVKVRREKIQSWYACSRANGKSMNRFEMPMQYCLKNATIQLKQPWLTDAEMTRVNLYCFRFCEDTHEVYVVPHQLKNVREVVPPNAEIWPWYKRYVSLGSDYIMIQNTEGKLDQLLDITNLNRFLQPEPFDPDKNICLKCKAKFANISELLVHEKLNCGEDIEVLTLEKDDEYYAYGSIPVGYPGFESKFYFLCRE
ncbi:protein terminus-like [Ceratitis capitata]|uniref:protein terminus-like n=1 Tax=Ceratitis capitata TaxID=7213 RepID=UPI000329EDB7|nr:protein terminus-like [Ceratitis capitata]